MSDETRKALEALERQLHESTARQSKARLRELLHPDIREVGRSGMAYSRDAIVAQAAVTEPPRIHAQDFEIVVVAPTVALLTYKAAYVDDDGRLSRHALRSSLWRRGENGWQLVLSSGDAGTGVTAHSNAIAARSSCGALTECDREGLAAGA